MSFQLTFLKAAGTQKWTGLAWTNTEPRAYQFDLLGTEISVTIPPGSSGTFTFPPDLQQVIITADSPRLGGIIKQTQTAPQWQYVGI